MCGVCLVVWGTCLVGACGCCVFFVYLIFSVRVFEMFLKFSRTPNCICKVHCFHYVFSSVFQPAQFFKKSKKEEKNWVGGRYFWFFPQKLLF